MLTSHWHVARVLLDEDWAILGCTVRLLPVFSRQGRQRVGKCPISLHGVQPSSSSPGETSLQRSSLPVVSQDGR